VNRRSPFDLLLSRLTSVSIADAIAGDLEELRRRHARVSRIGARLWFWRASLGVAVFVALRRTATAFRRMARGGFGLGGGRADLRYAVRSLRRAPWYALTVIGVIALGMSLATTVFAVVDGVLFKPLPYRDADRLVAIQPGFTDPSARGTPSVSANDLEAWQAAMPDVEFTGFGATEDSFLEAPNESGLGLAFVRPDFFDFLGVHPLAGGFAPADFERPTGALPVILSYEFWQARFGGATTALGTEIPVDSRIGRFRITGIMPPGFVLPSDEKANVLAPAAIGRTANPRTRALSVVARLPSGLSAEAFRARLEAVMHQLMQGQVVAPGGSRFSGPFDRAEVYPLHEYMGRGTAAVFRALFLASGVLLLIACLNVSGLMAARCTDRSRETALRLAIGARTQDVVRGLAVEHGLLLLLGTALGVAVSFGLLEITLALLPSEIHLLKTPGVDLRVAAFVALVTAASLVLASIWPLRRVLSAPLQEVVAAAGGGAATVRVRTSGWFAVVMGQVGGAMVLAVAGTLLVGSLLRVRANELGFEPDGLVIAELAVVPESPSQAGEAAPGVAVRLEGFLRDVRGLAGVRAAGAADVRVLSRSWVYPVRFDPVGREDGDRPSQLGVPVTPGFFEAAGLTLLEGRLPTDDEVAAGDPVVVVSRGYADAYYPEQPAVGQHVAPAVWQNDAFPPHRIVGVVADVRMAGWDLRRESCVFAPYTTFNQGASPVVFVRSDRASGRVVEEFLRSAERLRPTVRVARVQPASVMLADTIRPRRLQSWLFGAFALASVVLVAVGVLGLVAMAMSRRTREIGIRMALGATRDRLVSGLVREQLMPVMGGLAVGALVAAWTVRLLEAYLYELTIYDARVWAVALVAVTVTALTGALIPSMRASRVDPVKALRID
jgi:predicted permease